MAEDFSERFQEAFWALRERRLSCWERLIAEEILLRTWGQNRPHLQMRTLDLIAGVWGLSRGNVHPHLEELLRLNIVDNDARAATAARLGKDWHKSKGARPDRDAQVWWVNAIELWDVLPRVVAYSPAGRRAAECHAALCDANPESPGQMHLAGFEEQTGGEVQADAALARAESTPPASLAAAASSPASWFVRSKNWNETGRRSVPKTGTNVSESGTAVPKTGTKPGGPPEDAPASARPRPGSQEQNSQASQAARGAAGVKPGAETAKAARVYRGLTSAEQEVLDEVEAWCLEGGDPPEAILEFRPTWEGRIRAGQGLVVRVLRDVQLGLREGRDVVKKTRGGLLKCRYNEFLDRQPQKMHGPLKAARAAARPAAPVAPPLTQEEWEQNRAACQRMAAEFRERMEKGGSQS